MIFNARAFDKHFHRVIRQSEGAFFFLLFRTTSVINPQTKVAKPAHQLVCSSTGNWNEPKEKLEYELNGRLRVVEAVIYVPQPIDLRKGDLIYRLDTKEYFDVLNARNFTSHFQVEASMIEKGFNFNPLGAPPVASFVENFVNIEV